MAISVAQLKATIGLDSAAFDRGVAAVEGKLEKLTPKFQRMGVAMSAAITAPLAGLAARGIKVAGDLQQSLNALAATSGATGEQMSRLSKLAEDLGADLQLPGTSAADAARAMLELSKGGLSVADTMASARAVLQLSAAAQIDNARAAEIVADSLAQFRLSGDRAVNVADLLAGAANASTGSIDEMAQALAQSGTAFKLLGVPIEDAVASISLLAQAGIKGSDAGTSLKTALLRLNPTTKEAKAVMDKLKISFFDAGGEFVGMQKAASILQGALGKLSGQNQQTAISLIGGTDAMRALSIVAQAGADGFETMRDKVSEAGSAAKLAAAQNDGLKGALDALQSSIDTALNAAVKPFLGDLERMAKRAAEVAGKFGELDRATQKSIVFGVAGAALAGPALISLAALATALRTLLPAFKAVRVAAILTWATITGPLAPLILAATLAATLIWQAWDTNFMRIREITAAGWNEVKATFSAGASAISGTWRALIAFLTGEFDQAFVDIKGSAKSAMDFISRVLNPGRMAARAASAVVGALDKKNLDKVALTVDWFPGIKDQAKKAATDILDERKKLAQFMAGMAMIQPPKVATPKPQPKRRHVAGMFDDATKRKLSETEQQVKSFAQALREATTENAMLQSGASDTAIRLANSFNLVAEKQRKELAGYLDSNDALRRKRELMKSAASTVDELDRKFSAMTQKTLEGRLAYQLFNLSIGAVNKEQRELIRNAAEATRSIERQEEKDRQAKEASDERARILAITNGLFRDGARALDLVRDGSLENQIAWDAYGKSIRDVSDALNKHAIIAKAQSLRFAEMAKQANEAVVPLGNFLGFIEHLIQIMPQAPWEQNAAALRDWADAMITVEGTAADLRRELDLTRDGSAENRLAWEMFGVALEDLSDDALLAVLRLGDLQAEIDATAAKKDLLADLAQSTQDVFMDAFGRLREEGFGGFFRGVIDGFDRMLQQMASQFLASQLTNLIFGALGGGTPGIAGPVGGLFGGARAMGGPVDAGRSYLVGERGPELFVPSQSGRIDPNTGGSLRPVVVNMTVVTPDANSFRRSSGQVEASAAMALRRAARRAGDE